MIVDYNNEIIINRNIIVISQIATLQVLRCIY